MARNYRDAVHNIIRIETDTPDGRLLVDLIDTPEFQRLRRIRQLGLAFFAYQGAEHSRFTHSLGALNLATRLLDRLRGKYEISGEDRTAVRVAALLHDVGHGPFSHVIESILGFHHEQFSIEAITNGSTAIGKLLTAHSDTLADDVAAIIRGDFRRRSLAQLVSSQLDVDRMDYLLRDSLMTGAKYGIYDLEWIIKSVEINEADDHLYVSAPGIFAVEDYLQARYYMFRQVYFHRTLRSAEAVLKSLLRRAIELNANGGDVWHREGTAFAKVLRSEPLGLTEHLSLDDADFLFYIKEWRNSTDAILADLSSRFLDRRLFKAFDLDMPLELRAEFIGQVRDAVAANGLDPEYYVIEDAMNDANNYFYTRDKGKQKDLIYVEHGFSRPAIREISEVSAAVRGLQEGYSLHRLCFPAELKDEIGKLYRSI
ncbi:MAG TPA: HD domain-containing protein [Pyrinomonadaceae bacterium]|nr:HD domain-containing protein [Pyrinomonadaceae bacterium]